MKDAIAMTLVAVMLWGVAYWVFIGLSKVWKGLKWLRLWVLCKVQQPHDWMDHMCQCEVCLFRYKLEPCHYGCPGCDEGLRAKPLPKASIRRFK